MATVELTLDILKETTNGLMVTDGDVTTWLPKSQLTYEGVAVGQSAEIEMPEWLAIERGLV